MKLLFLSMNLMALSLNAVAASKYENLKSQKAKVAVCADISSKYQLKSSDWENQAYEEGLDSGLYIHIGQEECQEKAVMKVNKQKTTIKDFGKKKHVVGMEVHVNFKDYYCKAPIHRGSEVKLNKDGSYEVLLKAWTSYESECRLRYPKVLAKARVGDKNVKKVSYESIKRLNLLVPDYLLLGEPDDGAGTTGHTYYKVMSDKKVRGYMAQYTYYNSEGEWAIKYGFKYTSKGEYIHSLFSAGDADYDTVSARDYFELVEDVKSEILGAADKQVSYTDEEGFKWNTRSVESYELTQVSYPDEKEGYGQSVLYDLDLSIGMGNELDSSVVYQNNTCTATVGENDDGEWFVVEVNCKLVKY